MERQCFEGDHTRAPDREGDHDERSHSKYRMPWDMARLRNGQSEGRQRKAME